MKKAAFYIAGVLLAVGSAGHGVRYFSGMEVVVAGITVPMWVSFPAMIVAALLALWIIVGARRL
jgi:hypothetical protein